MEIYGNIKDIAVTRKIKLLKKPKYFSPLIIQLSMKRHM